MEKLTLLFFQTKGLSLEGVDLLYQNTITRRSVFYGQQPKRDCVELSVGGTQAKRDTASEHENV